MRVSKKIQNQRRMLLTGRFKNLNYLVFLGKLFSLFLNYFAIFLAFGDKKSNSFCSRSLRIIELVLKGNNIHTKFTFPMQYRSLDWQIIKNADSEVICRFADKNNLKLHTKHLIWDLIGKIALLVKKPREEFEFWQSFFLCFIMAIRYKKLLQIT